MFEIIRFYQEQNLINSSVHTDCMKERMIFQKVGQNVKSDFPRGRRLIFNVLTIFMEFSDFFSCVPGEY